MSDRRMFYNRDFTVKQIGWHSKDAVCPRCNRMFKLGKRGMTGRKTVLCKPCAVIVTLQERRRGNKA